MSKKSSSFLRHLNRNRKAPRSTLRVEPLESRQLWAVVEGAGKEVVSNVTNSDGVTYDQVLMTGSSVTVTNDAGQVSRVSYLDNDGDIVQVALVGPGKFNVSLQGAVTDVAPSNYNAAAQAYHYVQGDATITVSGSIDASSSLEVYSVGSARNPGVVDATHQGGDHWADISRVIIVGNEKNEAGYTNFGSIRTGNAFFSADSGVVGIRAENIAVQGVVRIGDIDATESGVPTLYFNSNSQFQNVFVQGGDLKQSNGASFDSFGGGEPGAPAGGGVGGVSLGGFAFFNSINGQDSQGNGLWSQPVNQDAIRLAAVDQQTLMSGDWVFGLDAATGKVTSALQNGVDVTTAYIGTTASPQASLDAAFERRTFTGNITINGDLKQNLEINLADARGNVTFSDNLFGSFVVDGYGASIGDQAAGTGLTVLKNLDGHVLVRGLDRVAIATNATLSASAVKHNVGDGQVNSIGKIVIEGSTGSFADIRAEDIGNVVVRHNFSGLLSTNVWNTNASTGNLDLGGVSWDAVNRTATGYVDFDGKIGNVTIGKAVDGTSNGGSIINGSIVGTSGIGDVWVGGDVYGSAPSSGVFVTSSNPGAAPTDVRNYGSANIGSITVHGDVDLDRASDLFIHIAGNGTFGNILVEGQITKTTDVVMGPGPDIVDPATPLKDARWISIFGPETAATESAWKNQDFNGADEGGTEYIVGDTTPVDSYTITGTTFSTAPVVTPGARPNDVGLVIGTAIGHTSAGGEIHYRIYRVEGATGHLIDDPAEVTKAPVIANGVKTYDKIVPGTMVAGNFVASEDGTGGYLFVQNTIAATTHKIPGPEVPVSQKTIIYSGNRGNLNGVFNNFGKIQIDGLLGAQQTTTGSISWTDSVDMDFGGITVNSSGDANANVIGSLGTIGQITIINTGLGVARLATVADNVPAQGTTPAVINEGKLIYEHQIFNAAGVATDTALLGERSDLVLSGTIGAKYLGSTNASTAFAGLTGLNVSAFEDVKFDAGLDSDNNPIASIIATKLGKGVDVKTVGGIGNGTGLGTISPSVIFNSMIYVNDGTAEAGSPEVLKIDVGMVNSSIIFAGASAVTTSNDGGARISGIIVTDGVVNADGTVRTGQLSAIGDISLSADYVDFQGTLQAGTIGNLTIKGGTGILSGSDTAVNFQPVIKANKVGTQTFDSTSGLLTIDEVVKPLAITNAPKFATLGDIAATSAFGNIAFRGTYQANLGNITLSTKDVVDRDDSGYGVDKVGTITIDGTIGYPVTGETAKDGALDGMPGGNVGNITATTTFGDIKNTGLTVRGNAGALTLTTGVGVTKSEGKIEFTETIWGTRGVATLDTAANAAGTITANFNYAGAFVGDAAADALIVTSNKAATVTVNVIENDDNLNGVISKSEIGHGGNLAISTVKDGGNVTLTLKTTFTEGAIHNATLGNVLLTGVNKDVTVKFQGTTAGAITGFEGGMGNLVATSSSNVNYGTPISSGVSSVIKGSIGNVTLTGGAVKIGDATDTLQIDGTRGKITAITGDGKDVSGGLKLNGKVDTANADALILGLDVLSNGGNIALNLAGAGEYGHAKFVSTGGKIDITNSITGKIGDVELTTAAKYAIKDGALDELTVGGDITLDGKAPDQGTWGKITAKTDAGTITHKGTWGSIGEISFTTGLYTDLDSNPNTGAADPGAIRAVGNIFLGVNGEAALQVAGDHTSATYKVVNSGTIKGSVIYSGAAAAGTLNKATTDTGDIDLTISVAKDQKSSGAAGDISLESLMAGNISLDLTSYNFEKGDSDAVRTINGVVYKVIETPLAAELTFGQITAKTGDVEKAKANEDDPSTRGTITITGSGNGAWANPLATKTDVNYPGKTSSPAANDNAGTTINRATVAGITANTMSGDISLSGDFAKVGDIKLTTGEALDASDADGKTEITAGDIAVGTAAGAPLSIWGESGTVTLTTTDMGGVKDPIGGTITGSLLFGGKAMNADSLVATTERAAINLKVFASGFDVNKDGRVTDGIDHNIPGDQEFAQVGNVRIETTDGGNIAFGAGLIAMDGTQVGPSIGAISLTANDDILVEAKAKDADTVIKPNVTFTGMTSLNKNDVVNGATTIADAPEAVIDGGNVAIAGTIGDVTMKVASGTANLTGNFVNLGAVTIVTGTRIDSSFYSPSGAGEVFGGNIQLGSGNSTTTAPDFANYTDSLRIAGTYKSSTLTVTETGMITGSVHVAGTPVAAGNDWALSSARGKIDVGFVAGFDADGFGGPGGTGAIEADETGKIGAIVATSSVNANVLIGVGGKADASTIGNVTVSTGDVFNGAKTGASDYLNYASGNTTVTGLGGKGTVGNIVADVKTGTAGLAGTFGNVGSITFRTTAAVDTDWTNNPKEDAIVVKAGDIKLTNVAIYGTHGAVDLKTVDTSVLSGNLATIERFKTFDANGDGVPADLVQDVDTNETDANGDTDENYGTIDGTITFSGGLAEGVTTGFLAVSDRGTITVGAKAGADENANSAYNDGEAGTVGNVEVKSLNGGSVTVDVGTSNWESSVGTVKATAIDIWQVWNRPADGGIPQKFGDAKVAGGNATVLSSAGFGTVGDITIKVDTGVASLGNSTPTTAAFRNVGNISVTGSNYIDSTNGASPAAVVAGGDVYANASFIGNVGTVALTAIDDAASGHAWLNGSAGTVTGVLNYAGPESATVGAINASSQQGDIILAITADSKDLAAIRLANGAAHLPEDKGDSISEDLIGKVGTVTATSLYGDITSTLTTGLAQKEGSTRTPAIGDVKLTTGSNYDVNTTGADTLVGADEGEITITGASRGVLGNIEAQTSTGLITLGGAYDNTVGNIKLTSLGRADVSQGTSTAGNVIFQGTFAANASTTVGTIDLATNAAASITIQHVADVAWVDNKVDANANPAITANDDIVQAGEQRTFSSGKLTAASVDGAINYKVDIRSVANDPATFEKEGYGSKLDTTELKTTGTGNVMIDDSIIAVSEITSFTASSGKGQVTFGSVTASTWDATTIKSVNFTGGTDVTMAANSRIALDFADAINNQGTSASIDSLSFLAKDGNVTVNGNITTAAHLQTALANKAKVGYVDSLDATHSAKNADNRSFEFKTLTFEARNGAAEGTTVDGNVNIAGLIGGAEVTNIAGITFTTPIASNDKVVLGSAANSNILAHDIGTLTVNGNTVFTQAAAGSANNIVANDANTVREVIGTKNYLDNSTELLQRKGSNLDTIGALVFNGAVWGDDEHTLTDSSTTAEISASKIESLTVNAKIDTSYTFTTSVQDLDVLVTNGTGEFIAANSATADAGAKYNRVTAFTIGNITINHLLQAPVGGTAVFGGESVISAIGGLGNVSIAATVNGNFQAPLFGAAANASAYFIVGDGNANIDASSGDFSNVVSNGATPILTASSPVVAGQLNVGSVHIDAASTTEGVIPQNKDISNAGGLNGAGFVLAVGAYGTAGLYDVGAASAINDVAAAGGLYGYISEIDVRNTGVRPDTSTVGAVTDQALAGQIVVVGGNTAADEIGDIVNEITIAPASGIVPMNDNTANLGYIIGGDSDNDGTPLEVGEENDAIIVYVL